MQQPNKTLFSNEASTLQLQRQCCRARIVTIVVLRHSWSMFRVTAVELDLCKTIGDALTFIWKAHLHGPKHIPVEPETRLGRQALNLDLNPKYPKIAVVL